jgi:hypothetical protein
MKPAPPFDCVECRRRIGKTRTHMLIGYPDQASTDRLLCIRCAEAPARQLHPKYYPDCEVHWHDLYDHGMAHATRAGAASLLGLWP